MKDTDGFRCKEAATYQSGPLRVDAEKGILYDAKILGFTSKNGRDYDLAGVTAALPLYDKVWSNIDHCDRGTSVPGNRKANDRFGRVHGAELREDGVYAKEYHFNPKHSFAPTFIWWAENEPEALGFSHDAILHGPRKSNGRRSIESISKVFSVDVVSDPGTTNSLFEETMNDEPMMPAAAGLSFEDGVAALGAAILSDTTLDTAAKRKKLLTLLKMLEGDESSETKPKDEPVTKPDEAKESELKALKLELDEFRAKEQANDTRVAAEAACVKHGLKPNQISTVFLDTLVERGQESWDATISDRKSLTLGRVTSASAGTGEKPSIDDFVARMNKGNR